MKKTIVEIQNRPGSAIQFRRRSSGKVKGENENMKRNIEGRRSSAEKEKIYYYSQLSDMLFEKAAEESGFVDDLNQVRRWFTEELSEVQKLVALRDFLLTMSLSKQKFLFNSISLDIEDGEEEEGVLSDDFKILHETRIQKDLDKKGKEDENETSKEEVNILSPQARNLDLEKAKIIFNDSFDFETEDRLKSLDLSPFCPYSDSLFSGISRLPTKNRNDSIPNERFRTDINRVKSVDALMISDEYFFYNFDEFGGRNLLPPASIMSPNSSESSTNKSSNFKIEKNDKDFGFKEQIQAKGKAPPGFLSASATEFRPSEPSTYTPVFITDFSAWLRLLRLHKYHDNLKACHEKDWEELLRFNDEELEKLGVGALGARKKFLRLFERIKLELDSN